MIIRHVNLLKAKRVILCEKKKSIESIFFKLKATVCPKTKISCPIIFLSILRNYSVLFTIKVHITARTYNNSHVLDRQKTPTLNVFILNIIIKLFVRHFKKSKFKKKNFKKKDEKGRERRK